MTKNLDIKLFRFNHKTDYLPYYKSYSMSYTQTETVMDLLKKLQNIENYSFNGVETFGVKINNLFLNVETPLSAIVEKLGSNELTIEPVSTYRVLHDLTIDNNDFFEKMDLFTKYLSQEEKKAYADTLQLNYYASNTLNFLKSYIGDHAILIASDIIAKNPELEDEIIELISNKDNGIWFNTSIEKRLFKTDNKKESKIKTLVSKVTKSTFESETTVARTVKLEQDFIGFNIAAYDKNDTCSLKEIVLQSKASFIATESQNDDLALHSLQADKNFTYKIAGKILLDAVDNNADFILVHDKKNFSLLDNNQKEIEKVIGRDINLPIVTVEQFNHILSGTKDPKKLGFDKHKVAVSFL